MLSSSTVNIVRRALNAGSESTIHQYYAKSQARKRISELAYVPDSVTLSAYHIARKVSVTVPSGL